MAEYRDLPDRFRDALTFGRPLRDGLELVRENGLGTMVVLGCGPCHQSQLDRGDVVDQPLTGEAILRAARDDNATVLDADLNRIVRKHTELRTSPTTQATGGGTRHNSAERFSSETGHPVAVVSEEKKKITVFHNGRQHLLQDRSELERKAGLLMAFVAFGDGQGRTQASKAELEDCLAELGRAEEPPRAPSTDTGLVDRHDHLRDLGKRLTEGPWGVTVLQGIRGIGKTKLVEAVLADLERQRAEGALLRIGRHDARPGAVFDVATLVDHLEGGPDPHRSTGKSSLVRLEVALRRLGGSRVVLVVDSAENLLDADGELADPDLDEALEMLATGYEHRVSVLVVSRREPVSPNGGTWPNAEPITLGRLPEPYFFTYLAALDPVDSGKLGSLSVADRRALYGRLRGIPRLGELAHAVAVVEDNRFDLPSLTAHLRQLDAKAVPDELTHLLVEGTSPVRRRVIEALAALDTPVPAETVAGMVKGAGADVISEELDALVARRIVHRAEHDRYFLPSEDGRLIMAALPRKRARPLYVLAADHLTPLRNPEPREIGDLRVYFAEVDALLRAGEFGAAVETMHGLHDILGEWNCRHLLFHRRKKLVGKFGGDLHWEKLNLNALVEIYRSRGKYEEAGKCLGDALRIAHAEQDALSTARLHTNLAGLYWEMNETERARGYFELARAENDRLLDPKIDIATAEGIADCHRRQGRYDQAIRHAELALDAAGRSDADEVRAFAASRTVTIALKLARWLAELGDRAGADRFVELARTTSTADGAVPLRAAYLNGFAVAQHYRDERELALASALGAVDLALRQRDPVILLEARTTLCLLYLHSGEVERARTEVELARPYRRKHRSLIVQALLALTAHRTGDRRAASKAFRRLFGEAEKRIARDERDFAARDLRGFAVCGLHLHNGDDLGAAVADFADARLLTPPTPPLVGRLRFMVEQLDGAGALRPVLDVL
ncbi:hypothetical protein ADK67_19040 [Saccharothrix sp. NRRL B-16348]|uniref:tetratricopeptide repeat protein n=1 Tax=Saccharothrix sp. NRRL B-16348 TaxID=1415542 RepID=UPI0006AF98BA|nr:tetratricopeptide repeat protein [Saccharothrix sp. NRRL B-16348]KOX24394.1 hypothetical protein ADK67_19040 [Saccharothrix sp. NRRL B-16348]